MDSVPNTFPHLFYAYSAVWALIVLYVACLGIKLKRIEKKVLGKEK